MTTKDTPQYKFNGKFFKEHPEELKAMANAIRDTDPVIVRACLDILEKKNQGKDLKAQTNKLKVIAALKETLDQVMSDEVKVNEDGNIRAVAIEIHCIDFKDEE